MNNFLYKVGCTRHVTLLKIQGNFSLQMLFRKSHRLSMIVLLQASSDSENILHSLLFLACLCAFSFGTDGLSVHVVNSDTAGFSSICWNNSPLDRVFKYQYEIYCRICYCFEALMIFDQTHSNQDYLNIYIPFFKRKFCIICWVFFYFGKRIW